MRRRKVLVVLAGLAVALAGLAVGVTAGAFMLWPRPSRVTRENFERIKKGMSRAEVEAILGPPGDSTTGPLYSASPLYSAIHGSIVDPAVERANHRDTWATDEACAVVGFGADGEAMELRFTSCTRATQDPLDNLLWRAKRQWHRWFP